jgi:hypothetical protein
MAVLAPFSHRQWPGTRPSRDQKLVLWTYLFSLFRDALRAHHSSAERSICISYNIDVDIGIGGPME